MFYCSQFIGSHFETVLIVYEGPKDATGKGWHIFKCTECLLSLIESEGEPRDVNKPPREG